MGTARPPPEVDNRNRDRDLRLEGHRDAALPGPVGSQQRDHRPQASPAERTALRNRGRQPGWGPAAAACYRCRRRLGSRGCAELGIDLEPSACFECQVKPVAAEPGSAQPAEARQRQPCVGRRNAGWRKPGCIHRGPCDECVLRGGALALGIRRLSIIDLEGGHQPIANEAGTVWVVLNGEIYNFRELRDELQPLGHRFKTRSDTEVVVHAYEQWGLGALSRLNGMFGLALWDSTSRSLVLARDPFGIKPLYVLDDGSRVVFGSEIRAIFADRTVPRTLDLEALDEYLALTFVRSPKTAFTKVEKLLPGHALVCTAGGTRLHRFQREVQGLIEPRSEEDLVQELRSEIAAAVRRQMVADVPVGAMLSGGTDSSTVATMMAEIAQAPIDTFTVGFAGDFAQNELAAARATAARIGSQHHEVVLSAGAALDLLPKAATHLEDLLATPS